MNEEQRERRGALLRSMQALLEYWRGERGALFFGEMEAVVKEIELLANEVDLAHGDPQERAWNWCCLGDAYFDLSDGKDRVRLNKSLEAYRKAKSLLQEIADPAEKMKLAFRCGDALFRLSKGRDPACLSEARSEYVQALEIARQLSEETAVAVEKALAAVNQLMELMEERGDLWRHIASRRTSFQADSPEYDLNIDMPEDAALFSKLLDVHHRMIVASQQPRADVAWASCP